MKLILSGHDDRYAIEQLQMSLFSQKEDGEALCALHRGNIWLTAVTTITIAGKTTRASRRLMAKEETVRLRRRILQQSFYLAALPHLVQLQCMDLYDLLRKLMEKNNWNLSLFATAMESYENVKPLSKEERYLLYLLLVYPEKFWKITNFYYNSKKKMLQEDKKRMKQMLHSFLAAELGFEPRQTESESVVLTVTQFRYALISHNVNYFTISIAICQ